MFEVGFFMYCMLGNIIYFYYSVWYVELLGFELYCLELEFCFYRCVVDGIIDRRLNRF